MFCLGKKFFVRKGLEIWTKPKFVDADEFPELTDDTHCRDSMQKIIFEDNCQMIMSINIKGCIDNWFIQNHTCRCPIQKFQI